MLLLDAVCRLVRHTAFHLHELRWPQNSNNDQEFSSEQDLPVCQMSPDTYFHADKCYVDMLVVT